MGGVALDADGQHVEGAGRRVGLPARDLDELDLLRVLALPLLLRADGVVDRTGDLDEVRTRQEAGEETEQDGPDDEGPAECPGTRSTTGLGGEERHAGSFHGGVRPRRSGSGVPTGASQVGAREQRLA